MTGLRQHTGIAAPLLRDNIDTDQIIPSREMKRVSKDGLGEGLFAGQRYMAPGSREINPDFVLNQETYQNASILLSGKNFGCGSSREHAVWALKEYGIRVIIAESFGEIFYNNCIGNGLLPIQLTAEDITNLGLNETFHIDLETLTILSGNTTISFRLPASDRDMLLKGFDPIALTLEHSKNIQAFLAEDQIRRPWIYA